ncbi:tryptophan synthase subunit alpha [Cryobacterium roopkundense]|uniref:tryptophan synthase n=1 Tax=Cryobacterium roopkundense TaxID=1001240 RepID=A0A7W9E4T3_9MICO|nr:tryptophan synthase alpha chain [Cryobacterium roopkundense]
MLVSDVLTAPEPRAFFAGPTHDRSGVVLFLNAGDPPDDTMVEIVRMMDEARVDCLELAVPFPDSFTDGPVVRRSADRSLHQKVDLSSALALVSRLRAVTTHTRIALLVDWSHSLKRRDLGEAVSAVRAAGADALLVHGLPPVLRSPFLDASTAADLPVVTTCYHGTSTDETVSAAAREASAYVYLVARYGRSGTRSADALRSVDASIARIRSLTAAPIAVGFGIATAEDVAAVRRAGADAAIIGTACVESIERGLREGDVVRSFSRFLDSLDLEHPQADPPRITPGTEPGPTIRTTQH